MPKTEKYCYECDTSFTVTGPKGFEIKHCPQCGTELGVDDDNEFEDELEELE